ncbi:MAG: sensor histidine kinase [Arachnia sp.]
MSPAVAALIGATIALVVVGIVTWARRAVRRTQEVLAAAVPGRDADLADVVQAVQLGAVLVGPKDEVVVANEAAAAMGLARASRVGSVELLDLIREVRRGHRTFVGAIPPHRVPGQPALELDGTLIALSDDSVLVLAEDPSASERVEAVRRDFVANVSHELKTPIGAIGILAEALDLARDDPEEVARFADRLQRETQRLSQLLAQIVELSRLEAADLFLVREVVEISEVVAESLGRSSTAAEQRNITLVGPGASAVRVLGDRWQLIDAVTNLVQNAIMYSDPRARVAVSVEAANVDGDEFVDIRVADNGIGIRLEDQTRIFERFYRVDYARSRENGGTGLGLSIVRHIALAHGGTITVWSRPQQGSTFTLRLPALLGEEHQT